MQTAASETWTEANQRYLSRELELVRGALRRHLARAQGAPAPDDPAREAPADAPGPAIPPVALETLGASFHLSPFERSVLLLCAGVELEAGFASLCGAVQGDPQRAYPTFSLALAALPEAHWSAVTPGGPLRHWRLIEVGAGASLAASPLRIDERVLHYLTGLQQPDERLAGIVVPAPAAGELVPSHQALAEQIAAVWARAAADAPLMAVQLCGGDVAAKRAIAALACGKLGLGLGVMACDAPPTAPGDLESLIRLWERESVLSASALFLDCGELDSGDAGRAAAVSRLIERLKGALFIATRERRPTLQRPVVTFDVQKPTPGEQRAAWGATLRVVARGLNGQAEGQIDQLVAQFNLSAQAIRAAGAEIQGRLLGAADGDADRTVWDACRIQARARLDDLAQRIEPAASWDDLVLPEAQRQILRQVTAHVRQRTRVYQTWGFAAKGSRGLGISALFAGASGTGKTMAAEVLANELRLDLYRIDLSAVVSKYIGETEKNLRRIFEAAEDGGAILLFDEADALFGKRSEVKDSHDRYANIEVSYLLQRMESYRGLAILTTNLKNALDTAFLRRIRFVVHFPFPDPAQRAEIWRRIFPRETPTEGLEPARLAQLSVAGGNIRNIALNAAFLAADADEPVRMSHLLRAARSEYGKLEKPLTEAETAGWT